MFISILILFLLLFIVVLEYIIKPFYKTYFEFTDKYGLIYVRTKGKGLGYVLKINIIPVRYPLPVVIHPIKEDSLSVSPLHHQRYLTKEEMGSLSFSLTTSHWEESFTIISPTDKTDFIEIIYSKEDRKTSFKYVTMNDYNYMARINKQIQLTNRYMIAVAQTEYVAPKYYRYVAHIFESCDRLRITLICELRKRTSYFKRYLPKEN